MSQTLSYVTHAEIERIRAGLRGPNSYLRSAVLADICRINALYMIMRAGSGHIGSSFSALDIMTWLWEEVMKHPSKPNGDLSDTFFSSKGHDAPGFYSLLIAQGKLDCKYVHQLRRLGGLPGHPDIKTPYIAANTGSLGMGISKAKGLVLGNRIQKKHGRVYVLSGDGELQEGQIWESLQGAANLGLSEIVLIVDHNTMQSDAFVTEVSDLGDLHVKFSSFGWDVLECDGHSFQSLDVAFSQLRDIVRKKPTAVI